MTKQRLFQRAEWEFVWSQHYPEMGFERSMYYTLFLIAGYRP